MKRFLFLDIDGVLNSRDWDRFYQDNDFKYNSDVDPDIDFRAVERINKLIEETGCEIILSSSWRFFLKETKNRLTNSGLRYEIKDIIKGMESVYDDDWPDVKHPTRGDLIADYVNENPCESYVILDDIDEMTEEQKPFFIKTKNNYGFTDKDLDQAINILAKKKAD